MKRALYTIVAMMLMTITGLMASCVPLEQALIPSTSPESSTSPSLPGKGMVEVHITDAPPEEQVTSILMTVSRVEIHKAGSDDEEQQPLEQEQEKLQEEGDGGGWITIDITRGTTFDLLKIKGLDELFAVSQVESGKYTQVRLTVDNVEVALGEEKPVEAKLPSGKLKLSHPFEVLAGETTVMLLDFDAKKSVNVTGNGKVMVKPVVKLNVKQKQKPEVQPVETEKMTQEESQKIAGEFVKKDETFTFDGIADTLILTGTDQANCLYCWTFTFEFDSRQAGYGNRAGQILAQVITHHTAVITMERGRITSAIMDRRWDMMKEKGTGAGSGSAGQMAVGASYNNKEVNVKVGDVLAVTLESNPTTGYKWQVKGISDKAVLENTGSEFIAGGAGAHGAGTPGKEVWIFKALKEGKSTLTMEYLRSWEGNVPAEKTFSLSVVGK